MRTTISLDDDLLKRLRALAHRQGTSLRRVVEELLRRALSTPEPGRRRRRTVHLKTFRSGFRPGIDPERLNQLVDELDIRDRTGGP